MFGPTTHSKNILYTNVQTLITSNKCVQNENPQNSSYNGGQEPPVGYDEQALKSVIRRYDTDGDGLLSSKELKKAFKSLGATAPGWRAIRALCHADQNRDGFISEKELANLVQYAAKRGYVL